MITKDFLREHFRKHDTLTLYKQNGTPVRFSKQYYLEIEGGHQRFYFKDYDALLAFYNEQKLRLKPATLMG